YQPRTPDAPGGSGHGFYPGGVYEYEKTFDVPDAWRGKAVMLEFEGIYKNSTVLLNRHKVGGRAYGYSGFCVDAAPHLQYGAQNVLTVRADNAQLPNSRWYTGGGIYRPVWLYVGEACHIAQAGVKITVLSYAPARVRVETTAVGAQTAQIGIEILRGNQIVAAAVGADVVLDIPHADLWSDETPNLYQCRAVLKQDNQVQDEAIENFGIRVIEWSPKGLFINGKETLLRGGCVHHDNGILGAATYAKSEERRVRILKQAGFNAIRSAHNPCSAAMLQACDKYGMYLMDESFDMWYNRKNKYDYGCDFDRCWQEDTAAMVTRDYNHPSVILYSVGNEVAEPHEQKGIEVGRAQIDLIHTLDKTRPVTCGVNLMILGRAAKGQGVYQDGAMSADVNKRKEKTEKNQNASLAFNMMASFIGTGMNKGGNSLKVDALAAPFADSLDIVGYNYGSGRYP
ncbi:MAG: glycoside hydrolase family 2 TIM barrel-domain containing protein, partial [Ruthenibacterium sp.]